MSTTPRRENPAFRTKPAEATLGIVWLVGLAAFIFLGVRFFIWLAQ